jgi:N-acetylneuraminic acid mutarotase
MSSLRSLVRSAVVLSLVLVASRVDAHFLWLKTDAAAAKPQAVLIFGETPMDEAYHLPGSLAETKIWCRTPGGERVELVTEKIENDDRIGLVGVIDEVQRPAGKPFALETTREYGVYGDFLLTYYPKHVHATSNDQLAAAGPSPESKLDLVPSATADGGVEITVVWDGKPQEGVQLTASVDEGDEVKVKTDANGKATFTPDKSGLVAVLANTTDEDAKGTVNGKEYTSAMHYATLTFPWTAVEGRGARSEERESEAKADGNKEEKAPATSSHLKPLPEAISSFGAAVSDGWLYIYSGHTGTEHDHSAANLSQNFRRIKLDGTTDWESLPMQTPLQGLAVVAHDGKIYRIGGMNARNATTKDDEDLHSTTEFAVFDPATKKWQDLAPLPAPRSSHNAAVIGDKLYVTGGWTLSGSRKGKWLTDSLVFDLKNPSAGWQPLPEQSFQRRALAAGTWQGKLVALGGMDEKQDVSQEVDLFDPQTGQWSKGPKLPGAGMAGFGVSAWNLDGDLYVSGFRGQVFRLTEDGSGWEEVARLATPRFFHQLVPAGVDGALIAVGGASRDGHLVDLELIKVDGSESKNAAASARSAAAHGNEG